MLPVGKRTGQLSKNTAERGEPVYFREITGLPTHVGWRPPSESYAVLSEGGSECRRGGGAGVAADIAGTNQKIKIRQIPRK